MRKPCDVHEWDKRGRCKCGAWLSPDRTLWFWRYDIWPESDEKAGQ